MILCIGEILADMIGNEKNGIMTFERYPGGAPFNVCVGTFFYLGARESAVSQHNKCVATSVIFLKIAVVVLQLMSKDKVL